MSDYLKHSNRGNNQFAWVMRLVVILLVILAGIWFMTGMPGSSWSGPLPPLTAKEQQIHDNLKRHVVVLADEIGERSVWRPQSMAAAAAYIRSAFAAAGYEVRVQSFSSRGESVSNLEAVLPGSAAANEIIVVVHFYFSKI